MRPLCLSLSLSTVSSGSVHVVASVRASLAFSDKIRADVCFQFSWSVFIFKFCLLSLSLAVLGLVVGVAAPLVAGKQGATLCS